MGQRNQAVQRLRRRSWGITAVCVPIFLMAFLKDMFTASRPPTYEMDPFCAFGVAVFVFWFIYVIFAVGRSHYLIDGPALKRAFR